jgi:hypothetical protein
MAVRSSYRDHCQFAFKLQMIAQMSDALTVLELGGEGNGSSGSSEPMQRPALL